MSTSDTAPPVVATADPFDPSDPEAIDLPADSWRWKVASLPHDQWLACRRRSAGSQPTNPTANEIHVADRAAFDELTGVRLRGPRRTAWGTFAWSNPDEPAIEALGEPPR